MPKQSSAKIEHPVAGPTAVRGARSECAAPAGWWPTEPPCDAGTPQTWSATPAAAPAAAPGHAATG